MQKILLLIFAVLLSLPTFAQREGSLLKIRDKEGRKITAEINGRRFDEVSQMLTFHDLPARLHTLKLYVVTGNSNGQRQARLIYAGKVRTKSGKIYYVTVDDFEKLDIIEDCCLGDDGPWNDDRAWYRSRYYDQQYWEKDLQFDPHDDHYYNYKDGDRAVTAKRNSNDDRWQRFDNVLSNARFNNLIAQMQNAGFESNRMNIVEQALLKNDVTTTQLIKIMQELSFESSRLQIAKMAYPKVADKDNTYRINDGFSFASSKDDFARFVKGER